MVKVLLVRLPVLLLVLVLLLLALVEVLLVLLVRDRASVVISNVTMVKRREKCPVVCLSSKINQKKS